MIARKNWLKYLVLPTFLLASVYPQHAIAAPKLVTVKAITKWSDAAGIELISTTNKAVITVKNSAATSADVEVQARDFSGAVIWSKTIDSGLDEVATAIASDAQGNVWIAGNSALAVAVETSTATAPALNPDGVDTEIPTPLRPDMRQLTLWKLNSVGELADKFTLLQSEISLVVSIAVSATGVSILAARENGSMVLSTNLKGLFGKELKIGTAKTKLNTIIRSSDGSVSVFGSSTETLGGKKLVGREDGVLIKISKAGAISSVVRSSVPKGFRNWNSATTSLFLTGSVKSGAQTESAITKFTNSFAPTWTTRIASTGSTLAASGPNNSFYVALEPTSAVKGLSNFKVIKGQNLILQFDSKGAISSAFTTAELSQARAITYTPEGGLFILTDNSIFKVGATK